LHIWEVVTQENTFGNLPLGKAFGNHQINIIVEPDITMIDIGIYSFGAYFQEPFHANIRNGK
jgi:hypothetical protein